MRQNTYSSLDKADDAQYDLHIMTVDPQSFCVEPFLIVLFLVWTIDIHEKNNEPQSNPKRRTRQTFLR